MASGETLLKFTDYPFAYSLIGIILGGIGFVFNQNQILFLGIAGGFGSLLTLSDPIGRFIRKRIEIRINKKFSEINRANIPTTINFMKSSIKSRSISIEIDKMVGLWYFLFITITFLIVIGLSPDFVQKIIENFPSTISCDVLCFQMISILSSMIIMGLLGWIATIFWRELDEKIEIAGHHQEAISNEYVTENSVENMSRSVESGDWETAKLWWTKIQDEIKNKKGKREIIIKSAEAIFKPLHIENISIESSFAQIAESRTYSQIPLDEWKRILRESAQGMIENSQLRKEIYDFYDKLEEYNQLAVQLNNKTKNEMSKIASQIFERDITEINYWVIRDKIHHNSPDLLSCILFNKHPLETAKISEPLQLDMRVIDNGKEKQITIPKQNTQFTKFEEFWKDMQTKISSEGHLTKLQKLCEELKLENLSLRKKYQEMIELQWKV